MGDSIHFLIDLTVTNPSDFLPFKREDSSPKENLTNNMHKSVDSFVGFISIEFGPTANGFGNLLV